MERKRDKKHRQNGYASCRGLVLPSSKGKIWTTEPVCYWIFSEVGFESGFEGLRVSSCLLEVAEEGEKSPSMGHCWDWWLVRWTLEPPQLNTEYLREQFNNMNTRRLFPAFVGTATPLDGESVAGTARQASASSLPREDSRGPCASKRASAQVLALCGRFVQQLRRRSRSGSRRWDLQWTFESSVQENVSINGQARQEAADNCFVESDIKTLEDQFDEVRVDIATKRKQYPRKILECVIKTLKAQHEVLKKFQPVVQSLDLKYEPDSDSPVENLKCRGESIAKEISGVMKALPALIEQADGFSPVLKMQPVIQLQRIHQEVFSSCHRKPDAKKSLLSQVETTPTETDSRRTSNVVLKRKQAQDCPQRKQYPLRPKRINFDTYHCLWEMKIDAINI
ncbi:kinetochore-associated protein NSL1 homolog [Thomomys bottae]